MGWGGLCSLGRGPSQPLGRVKATLSFLGHPGNGKYFSWKRKSGRLKAAGSPCMAARTEEQIAACSTAKRLQLLPLIA